MNKLWNQVAQDFSSYWNGQHFDMAKSPTQIVQEVGGGDFQLIKLKYSTEDGYINTVFRIIKRKDAKKTAIGIFRSKNKSKFDQFTNDEETFKED